jgi:hypothetical protein
VNAPSNVSLFELLNFCLQQHPDALGIFALNPRVREIRMPRKPAPSGTCFHRPDGSGPTFAPPCGICGENHATVEGCSACGRTIPYHDFPGREPRVTLLTLELPECVGQNLSGAEEDHAFLVAFSIDRAVYDQFARRAASPIIMPAGVLS